MSNIKSIILVTILIIFGFGVVGVLSEKSTVEQAQRLDRTPDAAAFDTKPDVKPEPKTKLSPELRQAYVEGCIGEDADMKPYCECTINELEKEHSDVEIIDMALNYTDTQQFDASMVDAVAKCLYLIK